LGHLTGARDHQARDPAQHRKRHDQGAEDGRIAAVARGEARDDRPEQDRHEGCSLDQRVASRELLAGQMIGQDAVFDWAEQRRDDAKQRQPAIPDADADCFGHLSEAETWDFILQ